VGFVWIEVTRLSSSILMSMSRKVAESGDIEWVNLRGEKPFSSSKNTDSSSGPCYHTIKMSSMNLAQNSGICSCPARNLDSSRPMVRLAYEGAILVPV
jgi:hypothetical protein